jgi:ABC-type transport system involved in multi-copper enzyme maturation permease subunit
MLLLGFLLTLGFILLYGVGAYFSFRHWEVWAAAEVSSGGAGGGPMDGGGPGGLGGSLDPALFRDLAAFQMLSFGMFIASFLGAMLVIFSAAGMIGGDAENGTLQTIATRPVSRVQILGGRLLGYASIFLAYLVLLAASLVALTRVYAGYVPPDAFTSVALLALQGLIVLGLVAAASALLPPLTAGIVAFMAFGLSFVGGVVEQIGSFLSSPTAEAIGRAVGYVVPTDPVFRMAIHGLAPELGPLELLEQQMGPLAGTPVRPGFLLYAVVYLGLFLVLAGILFRRKDL